jgi:hypothetical protein
LPLARLAWATAMPDRARTKMLTITARVEIREALLIDGELLGSEASFLSGESGDPDEVITQVRSP